MSNLRLSVDFNGAELDAALEAKRKRMAQRLRAAVEASGRARLLLPLRDETRRAFPGSRKLPTTWRGQIYPVAARNTLNPAYSVYSLFPPIIRVFSKDTTIRPTAGKRWLWIPTENVPKGTGGKPRSPAEVKATFGEFIFKPSRSGALALVEGEARTPSAKAGGTSRERRTARSSPYKRATRAGRKAGRVKLIPMFVLVRQVTLKQRLDARAMLLAAVPAFRADIQKAIATA